MPERPDPRTLLANERTLLSWLRTGISLMAFGFVVAKFNLFLQLHPSSKAHHHALFNPTTVGLAWVAAGIAVITASYVHFQIVSRQLQRGQPLGPSSIPTVLAVILLMLGVTVLTYLVIVS